jgi:hypothetical protein
MRDDEGRRLPISTLAALECLAEGGELGDAKTDEILDYYLTRIDSPPDSPDVVQRALGLVAARRDPTGDSVFERLARLARGPNATKAAAAANTLAASNRADAASLLMDLYLRDTRFREPLLRMGDLAVASLASQVLRGDVRLVDDLHRIRTPHAAEALLPGLWHEDRRVECEAAWCLGDLLREESVESALRECKLSRTQVDAPRLDYVWRPFQKSKESALPIIAGRIGLILSDPAASAPVGPRVLDLRLATPLFAFQRGQPAPLESLAAAIDKSAEMARLRIGLEELLPRAAVPVSKLVGRMPNPKKLFGDYRYLKALHGDDPVIFYRLWDEFLVRMIQKAPLPPPRSLLFDSLAAADRVELLVRCLNKWPEMGDWENVFRRGAYRLKSAPITLAICATIFLTTLASLVALFSWQWSHSALWTWATLGYVVLTLMLAVCYFSWVIIYGGFWKDEEDGDIVAYLFLGAVGLAAYPVVMAILRWNPAPRLLKKFRGAMKEFMGEEEIKEIKDHLLCFL